MSKNNCSSCRGPIIDGDWFYAFKNGHLYHTGECFGTRVSQHSYLCCLKRTVAISDDQMLSFQQMRRSSSGFEEKLDELTARVNQLAYAKK